MESRGRRVVAWVLRLLLAGIFVVSAVAKLVAIDHFEIYVFSYGVFSLNVSYVVARLCVGVELVLAVLLAGGWLPRLTRLVVLLLLLLFSLLLCYALLMGRDDSCQCFGELVPLSPAPSLLKNALLIVLTLWSLRTMGDGSRHAVAAVIPLRRIVAPLVCIVMLVLPFVVSVPDSWGYGPSREPYDEVALREALSVVDDGEEVIGGRLVVFITEGCPYCRMAREKVEGIVRRGALDGSLVRYVEPRDLPKGLFVRVTYGMRPLLLLMRGDSVVATYHLRNIDEEEICRTLEGK